MLTRGKKSRPAKLGSDGELSESKFCTNCGCVNKKSATRCKKCKEFFDVDLSSMATGWGPDYGKPSTRPYRTALARRFKVDVPLNLFFAREHDRKGSYLEDSWGAASVPAGFLLIGMLLPLTLASLLALWLHGGLTALIPLGIMVPCTVFIAKLYARMIQNEQKVRVIFGSTITCELVSQNAKQQLRIRYEYLDDDGHTQEEMQTIPRPDLNERGLPPSGTPVALLSSPGLDTLELL